MAQDWLESPFSLKNKRVWVAGHSGMVGGALCRRLQSEQCDILNVPKAALDLRNQQATCAWIQKNKPDAIILAAARVGGILANSENQADFLYDNMMIAGNVVHAAKEAGVEKLLFLGSSCIYPRGAAQPISEDALLSGPLEPTNEGYALAKIAGLKLCSYLYADDHDFISAMPCNLYGPGDNYDLKSSHVIPALIRKAHEAKTGGADHFTVWGSGQPLREFLYVDDLADALIFMLKNYSSARLLNIGSGQEISVADLAGEVAQVVGFKGRIEFDDTKPDGMMRKVMESSRIRAAGWTPKTSLKEGLCKSYKAYLESEGLRYAA